MISSSACTATVELTDPLEYYTNGDIVRGQVCVEMHRDIDVQVIEARLRCEEIAIVWVSSTQGGYCRTERQKLLSISQKLFPVDPRVDTGSPTPYDDDTENQDRTVYRMGKGMRTFDFAFMIPSVGSYPGTLNLRQSNARVEWYVKVIVRRPELTSLNIRASCPFHMIPAGPPPSLDDLSTYSNYTRLKVHLPGHPTGLKGLLDSEFRRVSEVQMMLSVPDSGVPQFPHPLSISLVIQSDMPELIVVRHLELYIKQKTLVYVDRGWHSDIVRDKYVLCCLGSDTNDALKGGSLDATHEAIKDTSIYPVLAGSFESPHFTHEYKLVAEAIVASRLHPSTKTRLRLSVPIRVLSRNVNQHLLEPKEELPTYAVKPRHDEELLSPPAFPDLFTTSPSSNVHVATVPLALN